jgi:hypothetical protein
MPLSLVSRIGEDTIGKLEAAARRRYAEACRLVVGEPLGAIYLFGYTVEIRLKAAYYRTKGLLPGTPLGPYRRPAETRIRFLLGLPMHDPVGHHVFGWARLVEDARAVTPGVAALPPGVSAAMNSHAQRVAACWVETLRYRANRPYNEELAAVQAAAQWFRNNYSRLWN